MITVNEVNDIHTINVNYLENPAIFSNTATTAIMFPVAQSILEQFETSKMSASDHDDKTGLCFLLHNTDQGITQVTLMHTSNILTVECNLYKRQRKQQLYLLFGKRTDIATKV